VIDEPKSISLNYKHNLNCLLKISIISHQKGHMDSKKKTTFIWRPFSSKERMAKFNLAYSSLKSKILQPIHNPTIIYIKILYTYSSKLGLHDTIINIHIKKNCCYELKKSSFNMLPFDFKLMNHCPKV